MPTSYWRPNATEASDQDPIARRLRMPPNGVVASPSRSPGLAPERVTPQQAVADPAVMGRVLGLLGFAFLFTAGGVVLGRLVGPSALPVGIVGGFVALIALLVLKEKAPLNLGVLYGFATLEGMVLSSLLEMLVGRGLGSIVLQAAAVTAAITMAAGAYGATTKRDLSTWGGVLFAGLLAVVASSLAAILLQAPIISLVVTPFSAALFTGFIVYDLNRVANVRGATEGTQILLAVSIYLDILNLFLDLLRLLVAFFGDD